MTRFSTRLGSSSGERIRDESKSWTWTAFARRHCLSVVQQKSEQSGRWRGLGGVEWAVGSFGKWIMRTFVDLGFVAFLQGEIE